MPSTTTTPSIHECHPLESGGTEARAGFAYQDHVAAGYCLDMPNNPTLQAVWCETQDDITLIRSPCGADEVEFVQVKSHQLDQLWSVAKLCKRQTKPSNQEGIGTSILEKSLAHDRCKEPCRFRLVTCRDVAGELKLLTLPIGSPGRSPKSGKFVNLRSTVLAKVSDFESPNGHDAAFWLENTSWEVKHSVESVKNENLIKLQCYVAQLGGFLAPDQMDEVYTRILQKTKDAADAKWEVSPDQKKIEQDEFCTWIKELVEQAQYPASVGARSKLKEKMESAHLPGDYIKTAADERLFYREELLTPKYLSIGDRELIDREVAARLKQLRSRLDAKELEDDGVKFHARCIEALDHLANNLTTTAKVPLSYLCGCMYDITNRCLHRFRRITA